MSDYLKVCYVVLSISIGFILLFGIVSSIGGSGIPRLVGLVLLAIETLVWSWFTGKSWRGEAW